MLSILYGLGSSLVWGAADFVGGLASRKSKAYLAVLLGESAGLAVLLVMRLFIREDPIGWNGLLLCSTAGSLGVIGLLLFFHAMTRGKMAVAAPVAAVVGALLPVVVGLVRDGFPGWLTMIGMILALAAVWFISKPDGSPRDIRMRLGDINLPVIAGICFGIYFILINQGSQGRVFWPMIASRTGGVMTMIIYTLAGRRSCLPPKSIWPLLILNGVFDISGNGLYIMAANSGRLDVAAVLASLYPGSTVILAWFVLHERFNRLQFIGVLAALAAIILMTL